MKEMSFRSPLRKLVTFFQRSRDAWKKKCQDAKYELKLLKRRFANLKKNHDQWQQKFQEAEAQRQQAEQRQQQLQTQLERLSQERAAFS